MKFFENIFSVGNEYGFLYKRKVFRLLGIKFKFNKKKLDYNFDGTNNKIYLKDGNRIFPCKGKYKNVRLSIKGNNNTIVIDKVFSEKYFLLFINIQGDNNLVNLGKSKYTKGLINIYGHNNTFEIKDTIHDLHYEVVFGCINQNGDLYTGNDSIKIGNNCSMGPIRFYISQKNTNIIIGDDCMFSSDITMQIPDGHIIYGKDTKKILNNKNYTINVGNHVWIGRGVYVLKNTKIRDNSIIGSRSVVTREFDEKHVAIAGNPADIIKREIDWDRESNF